MKTFVTGLVLSLAVSFSAFADSYLHDRAYLGECGGVVELRSYVNQNEVRYALQFKNVTQCSNVVFVNLGKSYKLTQNGQFLDKNITLSNDAVAQARYYGLSMVVKSNNPNGKRAHVIVRVR